MGLVEVVEGSRDRAVVEVIEVQWTNKLLWSGEGERRWTICVRKWGKWGWGIVRIWLVMVGAPEGDADVEAEL